MKLLKPEQFNMFGGNTAEHTFKTPSWIMLIPSAILFATCSGLLCGMINNFVSTFFWVVILSLLPIAILSFVKSFLPTLSIHNWVLKIKGRNIYVALNGRRNEPSKTGNLKVAFFNLSDVTTVREYQRLINTPGTANGKPVRWKERYLEFELKDAIPTNVREALYIENQKGPSKLQLTTKNRVFSSSILIDENKLRILWNGRSEFVRPSLQSVLSTISGLGTNESAPTGENKCPDEMLDGEFEDFLIELYQNGERISAVKSLCDQCGMSITDAVTKLESLAENQNSLQKQEI